MEGAKRHRSDFREGDLSSQLSPRLVRSRIASSCVDWVRDARARACALDCGGIDVDGTVGTLM
jgi:hypothetical protein